MRQVRMADVGEKPATLRRAVAQAELRAKPKVIAAIRNRRLPKGDVVSAAQIAGIQAAKKTAETIPLCHPLQLTYVDIDCRVEDSKVTLIAKVAAKESTGVEMEALTACAAAALTVYDMTKSLDRGMRVTNLCLLEKSGGRSGTWRRK